MPLAKNENMLLKNDKFLQKIRSPVRKMVPCRAVQDK